MSEEIKFNTDVDILLQIGTMSYCKFNDKLCSINEHLGDIYSYKDLKETEECEKTYEYRLMEIAIKQLQQENKELRETIKADEKANLILANDNKMLRRSKKNAYQEFKKKHNSLYKQKIDKAIEILKLCNSKCSKEVIEILEGDK